MKGLLLFMAGCILLTGCKSDDSNPKQTALDANQTKWSNAALNSYRFTRGEICYCPVQEARVISVVDNVVTDAFYTPSGTLIDSEVFAGYWTIDDYFGLIQRGIDENYTLLDVTYDSTYGFPISISIDQSPNIVDEEITYSIRDFQ